MIAQIAGSSLKVNEHVFSIMLSDQDKNPLPLYYTKHTTVSSDGDTTITVTLTFDKDEEIPADARVYVLVDTYPIEIR